MPEVNHSPYLNQLKRWAVILLVVLQAATVISILFFSGLASEAALLRQAKKILNGATLETVGHAEAFLGRAYGQAVITAELLGSGVLEAGDTEQLESYFVSQLDANPSFAGIYLGTESGEFVYLSRAVDEAAGKYRLKHVRRVNGGTETTLWWRNTAAGKLGGISDPQDDFDPRSRPWYRDAKASAAFSWTDPYIFFTAQQLGITAANPVYDTNGSFIGVIGVDVELQALAGFLAELDISDAGSAFIASTDGLLIAAPHLRNQAVRDLEALSLDAMSDPIARNVLDAIRDASLVSSMSHSTSFTAGKIRYIADSMPLTLTDGDRWLIATYAPRADFLGDIRASERRSMYLAIGIMCLAVLIGVLLTSTAWTPLEMLHFQANRDQLTQIHNRHFLMKHGKRLFAEARLQNEPLSAAIIDLDHFKQINDGRGHAAGDAVIKAMAQRLTEVSRAHDLVARYGGEEFVMLLPTADAQTAKGVLERARASLEERPIEHNGQVIPVTFSAGVCQINEHINTMEPVLNAADKALYRAKSNGRDQVVVAPPPAVEQNPNDSGAIAAICP